MVRADPEVVIRIHAIVNGVNPLVQILKFVGMGEISLELTMNLSEITNVH